jgi:hypothetical protein
MKVRRSGCDVDPRLFLGELCAVNRAASAQLSICQIDAIECWALSQFETEHLNLKWGGLFWGRAIATRFSSPVPFLCFFIRVIMLPECHMASAAIGVEMVA